MDVIYPELQQTLFVSTFSWSTESAITAITDEESHSLRATDPFYRTYTGCESMPNTILKPGLIILFIV